MRIFAEYFRGFRAIEIDLSKITVLVGDNSSGKSSILHLVDSVTRGGLNSAPRLNENLGVSEYDYFSPYFDGADVTFGFSEIGDQKSFAKVITVHQSGDKAPSVVRCSYLIDGTIITLKRRGATLFARVMREFKPSDFREILERHNLGSGFQRKTSSIRGVSLADPVMLFSLDVIGKLEDGDLVSRFFETEPIGARLVSPVRALPEKFYSASRKISALGLHFATMWHDFSTNLSGKALKHAEAFGRESNLFEKINVRKVSSKVKSSPLLVSVEKSGQEFLLNQVGVGVSQVVPILVESVFAISSNPKLSILLQQPELHLHPVAQAALGTYIYRIASDGLRGVIETHSSYFLDRLRAEIRENSISKHRDELAFDHHSIEILFCENSPEGNVAYSVLVLPDGKLQGEPDSYHHFFVDELMRTMF